ncbi:MAG: hypothetical protein KJO49_09855 [Bacteroidia bacterium]|nr:hypothetical protein [Bacteroidia bacterium]
MNHSKFIFLLGLSILVMSCDPKVNLDLTDKRPVKSIKIDDAEEASLIQQELDIEVKYVANNTLYFYSDNQETLSQLEEIGYLVKDENPKQISFRMVKLISKNKTSLSTEKNISILKELQEYRIKVFNREKSHWVIYGSLDDLSRLKELGFVMENLETEIHPRSVKIIVPSKDDIQKINEMGVDIYSSGQEGDSYLVYGGAYDYQIDLMAEAGYQISKEN